MPKIVTVDENDNVTGAEIRKVVREKGLRHRIVRIFLVNSKGQILLHKRSDDLKDNPGRWDQSVGGHVDEGEDYIDTAKRETLEELGVSIDNFQEIGKFYIEREAPGGFVRRFQKVFTARWDEDIIFDKNEISEVKWFDMDEVSDWVRRRPADFTRNFHKAFELLQKNI